jgi:hypothetical protein
MIRRAWRLEPWVTVTARPWRTADSGEIAAKACSEIPTGKSSNGANGYVPQNAALPRTFVEATRPKEMEAFLKFGTDSNWPLKITVASALDEMNSILV